MSWVEAMNWLSAAADDPHACRKEWNYGERGVHLLAAGRFWDVLVLPEHLGRVTLGIVEDMPRTPLGPALAHAQRREIGLLLPPDPTATWRGGGVRHVTEGAWIPAPPPHRRHGTLHWIVPPDGLGTLHVPQAVGSALDRAARRLGTRLSA